MLNPVNNETIPVGSGRALLNWEVSDIDGDIVSFEVFFDEENPPLISGGTTSDTEITVNVTANKTYYWSVQTIDSVNNISKSDVFSFSIE